MGPEQKGNMGPRPTGRPVGRPASRDRRLTLIPCARPKRAWTSSPRPGWPRSARRACARPSGSSTAATPRAGPCAPRALPSAAGSDEADAALIDPSMPARVVQCVERPHPAEALTTTSPRKMLTKQTGPKQSLITTEFARRRREVALLGAPRSIRRSEAAILSEHETATCQRRRPVNPKP